MTGRRATLLVAALGMACGKSADRPIVRAAAVDAAAAPSGGPDQTVLAEIVAHEGARDLSDGRLEELARKGTPVERAAAIRALGRIGGPIAARALLAMAGDAATAIEDRRAAAEALGLASIAPTLAASTPAEGQPAPAMPAAAQVSETIAALAESAGASDGVLRALGRVGDSGRAMRVLVAALKGSDPALRAEAALALGAYGHRKQTISAEAGAILAKAAWDTDAAVRYAVAYALFREHLTPPAPPAGDKPAGEPTAPAKPVKPAPPRLRDDARETLVRLAADSDPDVRAMSLRALAREGTGQAKLFGKALADADERVQVEAVRALLGEGATAETRATVAEWATKRWDTLYVSDGLLEALGKLGPQAKERAVARLAAAVLAQPRGGRPMSMDDGQNIEVPSEPVHDATARCLAVALQVRARAAKLADVEGCDHRWPEWRRHELAAQLIGEGVGGSLEGRVTALMELWKDEDPRSRGAVAAAAVTLADPRAHKIVLAAIDDAAPEIAGNVLDALTAALAPPPAAAGGPGATPTAAPVHPGILEAVSARVASGKVDDKELLLGFLDFLAKAKVQAAVEPARRLLADPNVTIRAKAREVVTALTGKDPGPVANPARNPTPPVDPAPLLGKTVVFTVTTTRGPFTLELDPGLAPWNVATLAKLAGDKKFDGTPWHRVVFDFVVQGGDPRGSGWGGPGYAVPAEPSFTPYARGTVGIADAGLDTGGSQWFVTHTRTPHLEARYTVVGHVTAGLEVIDALLVGDKIETVAVEIR